MKGKSNEIILFFPTLVDFTPQFITKKWFKKILTKKLFEFFITPHEYVFCSNNLLINQIELKCYKVKKFYM